MIWKRWDAFLRSSLQVPHFGAEVGNQGFSFQSLLKITPGETEEEMALRLFSPLCQPLSSIFKQYIFFSFLLTSLFILLINIFRASSPDQVETVADCLLIENLLHVVSLLEDIEPIDPSVDVLRFMSPPKSKTNKNSDSFFFFTEMMPKHTEKLRLQQLPRELLIVQSQGNIGPLGLDMEHIV